MTFIRMMVNQHAFTDMGLELQILDEIIEMYHEVPT